MASLTVTVDTRKFDRGTKKFVRSMSRLPNNKRKNPLMLAITDYRVLLNKTVRPTVRTSAKYLGNLWPALKESTLRGKTTAGNRYTSSTKQLGQRAGGLWTDFLQSRILMAKRNLEARIVSNKTYAVYVAAMRDWAGGSVIAKFLNKRAAVRVNEYAKKELRRSYGRS